VPLSLGNATGALVAQAIGAGDARTAQRVGAHGVTLAAGVAVTLGALVFFGRGGLLHLYTSDPTIIAAALPLLAWVMFFHVGDAIQAVTAFVLRAHRIATLPLIIYATASWGVGLGGGFLIAFDTPSWVPSALHGASGFWAAGTAGVAITSTTLVACMVWVHRRERVVEQVSTTAARATTAEV
jgi:MATE family multidrug resistance protein